MALDLSGLSGLTESFADGKPVRKILDIDISLISPDPLQPRKEFNEDKLQDLAASIGEYGLIQPIVVTSSWPVKDGIEPAKFSARNLSAVSCKKRKIHWHFPIFKLQKISSGRTFRSLSSLNLFAC